MYDVLIAKRSVAYWFAACLALLLWPLAMRDLSEGLAFRTAREFPVVTGVVTHVYETNVMLFASRAAYVIRHDDEPINSTAILSHDGAGTFSNIVSFYFDGDQSSEVFIVGEQDPQVYATIEFLIPFLPILLHRIYYAVIGPNQPVEQNALHGWQRR